MVKRIEGGASVDGVARAAGVTPKALRWWRWRLRPERGEPRSTVAATLLPVEVVGIPCPRPERVIEIATATTTVRVPIGTEPSYVAELVTALRSRSC